MRLHHMFLLATLVFNVIVSATGQARNGTKIAVVGGGISGLSAAYHLAQAGYDDITIFEETYRVGGWVVSLPHKNITHDMTAYAVTPIYWRFQQAVERLGVKFCGSSATIISTEQTPVTTIEVQTFLADLMSQTLHDPSTLPEQRKIQVEKYITLWTELFEVGYLDSNLRTEYVFPPRMPTDPVKLRKLATPMTELLQQEGLDLLIPIFRLYTNSQAYGPVDTTAAVYVMSWVHPSLMVRTVNGEYPCGKFDSFQAIIDVMAESMSESVTIRYGTPVRRVIRGKRGAQVVIGNGVSENFDSIVVTSRLPESKEDTFLVHPVSEIERRLARTVQSTEVYTALLEGSRKTAIAKSKYIAYDARSLSASAVNENFYGTITHEARDRRVSSDKNAIAREIGLFFYANQLNDTPVLLTNAQKDRIAFTRLSTWDNTKWKTIASFSFRRYFQRWRPSDVRKGLPWAVKSIQGKGNVFYISAFACGFENFAHLFDCAKHLVDDHF